MDNNLINASYDLGATKWETFRHVIFPLSMNGVRSGVQSVFIPSLSLFYLPIFYLIGYAFNAGDDMNSFTGFSWTHFETMFGDGRLMLILAQTFFLAFLSALIATIIGTFGAIYIYQSRKKY
ncbi:ABC transporter permease subunit, partial [Streptococcus pneumoniae]|uniref:ABC transporter permease subunit n=1 Tax=Streptococcus pneumoniae TaxID=1313 RepID=UPI001C727E7E